MHAYDSGVEMDIGAFKGKDSENNRIMLVTLALNDSLIKWEILKKVTEEKKQITWATVSRRVDDLRKRDYIMETGKRRITVAKRELDTLEYGLTWKGIIASLTSKEVRKNIIKVIEGILAVEKYQIEPQYKILEIVRRIYKENEIRDMTEKFYEAIKIMPLELESANEIEFMFYLFPALTKIGFSIPKKDLSELKQKPDFLNWLYNACVEQEEELLKSLEAVRKAKLEIEKILESGE